MARVEPCILTNMVMVENDDGRVLVQHRSDPNWPGHVFPGGHVEAAESFVASAVREVKEETGLDVADLQLCGVKQFTQPGKYRYVVLLFKTKRFSGTLTSSAEGEVFWCTREELRRLELADGFGEMLPLFCGESTELYFTKENDDWLPHYA